MCLFMSLSILAVGLFATIAPHSFREFGNKVRRDTGIPLWWSGLYTGHPDLQDSLYRWTGGVMVVVATVTVILCMLE